MASGCPPPFGDPAEVREGFLCPLCLKDLRAFQQLQAHYEEEHSGEDRAVRAQLRSKGAARRAPGSGSRSAAGAAGSRPRPSGPGPGRARFPAPRPDLPGTGRAPLPLCYWLGRLAGPGLAGARLLGV